MSEFLQCVLAIGIVMVGAMIVYGLFITTPEMANWSEEEWIENYEGDVDDPMWD